MKNIHRQLLEYMQSGERMVLATVVRTSGSTPQKPGSSALFGEKGLIAGTVGGGLLEGEVQEIASHVLISEVSDQYYFNLDAEQGEEGAICGGEAEVLVDANPLASEQVMEEMNHSLSKRLKGNIATVVSRLPDGGCAIDRYWITGGEGQVKPAGLDPELWSRISDHLSEKTDQGFREIEVSTGTGTGKWSLFLE